MAPGSVAVDIRRKSDLVSHHWFGNAISSPGFMHSLLCTIALHRYFMRRGSYTSIIHHKTEAITAINAALRNPDPEIRVSDANIGAVFNLLCVEEALAHDIFKGERQHEDDQYRQRRIHLNGLLRMVHLRGGLQNIKSNRCLQAFILWYVLHLISCYSVSHHCISPNRAGNMLTEHQAFYSARHSFIHGSLSFHFGL